MPRVVDALHSAARGMFDHFLRKLIGIFMSLLLLWNEVFGSLRVVDRRMGVLRGVTAEKRLQSRVLLSVLY